MTSSLVGSEMCIRDRSTNMLTAHFDMETDLEIPAFGREAKLKVAPHALRAMPPVFGLVRAALDIDKYAWRGTPKAVSYTHLRAHETR
eukprot:11547090-Prorocentrum_lima.AAC.1